MKNCAEQDGRLTTVGFMQDPASAGLYEAQQAARALDGFAVKFAPASGDKETRAKPISAQVEAGNVKLVRGPWNDAFLTELENFPAGKHDDQVDALSGAHETLATAGGFTSASQLHTGAWRQWAADPLIEIDRIREDDL
jgi:predicted phage terminase large subunit-like protein